MTAVPDHSTFESAYAGQAPWDIGRPQKALLDVAEQNRRRVETGAKEKGLLAGVAAGPVIANCLPLPGHASSSRWRRGHRKMEGYTP